MEDEVGQELCARRVRLPAAEARFVRRTQMRSTPSLASVILLAALAAAAACVARVPPPCANDSTVYKITLADTSRGFLIPAIRQLPVPPYEFHGAAEVWLLVDARGHVVRDSTKVTGASPRNAALLRDAVADYRFDPAQRGSCAVATWWFVRFAKP